MDAHSDARVNFPYEIVPVSGDVALQEWEQLKRAGRGAPVIVGSDHELELVLAPFEPQSSGTGYDSEVAKILANADRLIHPDDLSALRKSEMEEFSTGYESAPRDGRWYDALLKPFRGATYGSAADSEPMRWGDWNDNPPPSTMLRRCGRGATARGPS